MSVQLVHCTDVRVDPSLLSGSAVVADTTDSDGVAGEYSVVTSAAVSSADDLRLKPYCSATVSSKSE